MKKICTDCNAIFDGKLTSDICPSATCEGFLVEVDEMLIDVIKLFWELGVGTRFCCAGHLVENCFSPYIIFDQPDGFSANVSRLRELLVETCCGEDIVRVEDIFHVDQLLQFLKQVHHYYQRLRLF